MLTALLTGLFCHLVLNMALMEGMLLGAVLGSTDAASVFSILRSRKLNLKYGTASMLELESGSNDPFAYMMTVILLSAMTGSVSGGSAVLLLIRQLAFGLLTGATVAWLVTWLLKRYAFYGEGFDTIFVFAAAIISYALASQIGGNGPAQRLRLLGGHQYVRPDRDRRSEDLHPGLLYLLCVHFRAGSDWRPGDPPVSIPGPII